jgi:hypothetical protein
MRQCGVGNLHTLNCHIWFQRPDYTGSVEQRWIEREVIKMIEAVYYFEAALVVISVIGWLFAAFTLWLAGR